MRLRQLPPLHFMDNFAFIMLDPLTTSDAVKDRGFLIMPLRRNENCTGLADDFCGDIAEEPLCGLVPSRYDAVEVLRKD